jgi:hypothetical protein
VGYELQLILLTAIAISVCAVVLVIGGYRVDAWDERPDGTSRGFAFAPGRPGKKPTRRVAPK